jgi:DNA polymerase-4
MPMAEALRRCPQAVCVPPRMARYQEVSAQVFDIFHEFTPLVEGLSLDEAFLDVTASLDLMGDGVTIAQEIRRRIHAATGLTASIGISPNKLLAKIASDLGKPDGLCRIGADNLHDILDPLPIRRLFGVGEKSLPAALAAGIHTFGDLRVAPDAVLWRAFGKHGKAMRDRASGIDDRPVQADRDEKSLSAEETFEVDIRDIAQLERQLLRLADRAAARLRAHGFLAGKIMVKIRRQDFTTYSRQRSVAPATQETSVIVGIARALLADWVRTQRHVAVRLLGVGVGALHGSRQADLFANDGRGAALDTTIDGIRERFGTAMLTRASLLPLSRRGSGEAS